MQKDAGRKLLAEITRSGRKLQWRTLKLSDLPLLSSLTTFLRNLYSNLPTTFILLGVRQRTSLDAVGLFTPKSPAMSVTPSFSIRMQTHCRAFGCFLQTRNYAVQAPGRPTFEVFNRAVKHMQKDRAARNVEQSRQVDYIKDEVAKRLCERLLDIKRSFPHALDLGANSCNIARALTAPTPDPALETSPPLSRRIGNLTCIDTSHALLHRDIDHEFNNRLSIKREVIPDLESLPFEANTFDAVLSSLSIHWINDLPSLLAQINNILKPDSPFIAAMFGGDTLFELRSSLQLANMERRGGVIPHVSPLADVRDVGGLLTKAGFKMLTVDVEDIVVDFPNTFALMEDLQAMGESNATVQMGTLSRDVLLANEAIYRELHKEEINDTESQHSGVPATFRIIFMIGWKEGAGQPEPLKRGSGEVNLKDILGGGDFEPK